MTGGLLCGRAGKASEQDNAVIKVMREGNLWMGHERPGGHCSSVVAECYRLGN